MKLHKTEIIHNDLKLDNLMVNMKQEEVEVKIIDLGMAQFEGGSPYQGISLERIHRYKQIDPLLANGGRCSPKTDLFSIGLCLLQVGKLYDCPIFCYYGVLLQDHEGDQIDIE